jgi:2-hydroxychromene-2-carboxylate isomerase
MQSLGTVDFFFDFASPYACLSVLRVRALAEAAAVTVRWRPFLLGPIFRAEGLNDSPLNVFPLRGAYARLDFARRGRRYGFDVRFPSAFPRNGLLAARMALVALEEGFGEDFTEAVFRAEFQRDEDISSPEVLGALVAGLGKESAKLLAAAEAPSVKGALRTQTEAAQALGIFGAPSFVSAGQLFWGDDRLEDALEAARGASNDGEGVEQSVVLTPGAPSP